MTEEVETKLTGKCFKCGDPVTLGRDGVYEGKECCYNCFVSYFREGIK